MQSGPSLYDPLPLFISHPIEALTIVFKHFSLKLVALHLSSLRAPGAWTRGLSCSLLYPQARLPDTVPRA